MNKIIINQFELLIKQIELDISFSYGKEQLVNSYRLAAVKKVLKILEKFPDEIKSSDQLKNIKNVGKKSLERINEILTTGKLSEIKINEESFEYLKIITELEEVFGIGKKKAYELFMKHSITSIDDLKKKAKDGSIKLPEYILKGLEYVGKLNNEIPRNEIEKIDKILKTTTLLISPKLFGITCGSFRRQKQKSGDIDFLLFNTELLTKSDIAKSKINYLQVFINSLKKQKIIIESLTSDDVATKYMGICKLLNGDYCRIDIRLIQYESFYPAILYFTGSRDLNKKMRQLAISNGYLLNEYGIYQTKQIQSDNNMLKVNSEKEIFQILKMEYVEPIDR